MRGVGHCRRGRAPGDITREEYQATFDRYMEETRSAQSTDSEEPAGGEDSKQADPGDIGDGGGRTTSGCAELMGRAAKC